MLARAGVNDGKRKRATSLALIAFLSASVLIGHAGGEWTTRKSALFKRTEVAAVSIGEKIFVIGGIKTYLVTDVVEEYDTRSDSWRKKGLASHEPASRGRGGHW